MSFDTPTGVTHSRATVRDVKRAIAAIDRVEERVGTDEFSDFEYDQLSTARGHLNEWLMERGEA